MIDAKRSGSHLSEGTLEAAGDTRIDSKAMIRPNPRVAYRHLADGAGGVLLHLDTTMYHGVNEIGAAIWRLMGEGSTFGSILEGLWNELDVAPPTLDIEISAFLIELESRELVSIETSPENG